VSDIGDVLGLGDLRLGEASSLVGLRRRVIELEQAQALARLEPVGEGVEPRAEHENLLHALRNRATRRILGKSATHRDEQAQGPPLRPFLGEGDRVVGVLA